MGVCEREGGRELEGKREEGREGGREGGRREKREGKRERENENSKALMYMYIKQLYVESISIIMYDVYTCTCNSLFRRYYVR